MFSISLESTKAMLFQARDAYSSFDRIKARYRTFRLSKEEKLYVMKRISRGFFNENISIQHDDGNAVYYLI
jgi:hypothetical protein